MKKLPFIVAVDFDGTLVTEAFPNIGEKIDEIFNAVIRWKKEGIKVVLWTCRDNDTPERHLDQAVEFCARNGLEFDSVNRNIPEVIEMFKNDTRKIYANVYLDDKALRPSAVEILRNYNPLEFMAWKPQKNNPYRCKVGDS